MSVFCVVNITFTLLFFFAASTAYKLSADSGTSVNWIWVNKQCQSNFTFLWNLLVPQLSILRINKWSSHVSVTGANAKCNLTWFECTCTLTAMCDSQCVTHGYLKIPQPWQWNWPFLISSMSHVKISLIWCECTLTPYLQMPQPSQWNCPLSTSSNSLQTPQK